MTRYSVPESVKRSAASVEADKQQADAQTPAHQSLLVCRICSAEEWAAAQAAGAFAGGELDARDGFIHLSHPDQVAGTLKAHFVGVPDLMVLWLDAAALGERLRWEESRDAALFPHLYGGPAPLSAVVHVTPAREFAT